MITAEPDPNSSGSRQRPATFPYLPVFLGTVAGGVFALLALAVWFAAHRPPVLTDAGFEEAISRWKSARLGDYRIQTTVSGRQGATYLVEVRNSRPVFASRNGHRLPQERVWQTWTVDGMFATMRSDVRVRARRRESLDRSLPDLILRAEFDSARGLPRRYVRIDRNTPYDVSWQVDSFEDLSAAANSARGSE